MATSDTYFTADAQSQAMTEHHVWRTHSDLRWTFVSAPTITEALVQLARVLDDFGLEPFVSHLDLSIDDEGVVVGALTEQARR